MAISDYCGSHQSALDNRVEDNNERTVAVSSGSKFLVLSFPGKPKHSGVLTIDHIINPQTRRHFERKSHHLSHHARAIFKKCACLRSGINDTVQFEHFLVFLLPNKKEKRERTKQKHFHQNFRLILMSVQHFWDTSIRQAKLSMQYVRFYSARFP